jgi:hypothetical protein
VPKLSEANLMPTAISANQNEAKTIHKACMLLRQIGVKPPWVLRKQLWKM